MKKRPAATLLGMSFLLLIVSLWAAGIRASDRPLFAKPGRGSLWWWNRITAGCWLSIGRTAVSPAFR